MNPILFALFGCTQTVTSTLSDKMYFMEVSVEDTTDNTEPLPFFAEPIERTLSVKTLDGNGDDFAFTGDLKVTVRPGRLASDQDPWVSVENGQIVEGDETIRFQAAFGPTRIWLSDEGDKDQTSEREPTFATGVSEVLNFTFPTIAEFNKTTDTNGEAYIQNTTNHLVSEFTEVNLANRDVIATVVSPNGFWVTDVDDYNNSEDGGFASLYVYTFSKPTGVEVGSRITKLTGGNQEYLGSTQLSFPEYEVDENLALDLVPEPKTLTTAQACNTSNREYDNHRMESFESALVRIESATIAFNGDADEIADYLDYGQWPVTISDGSTPCTMYVDSSALSYAFDPIALDGTDIGAVTGVLNQIWSNWIIILTDDESLSEEFAADATPRRPRGPSRPTARFPNGER
jgi:hypothetical protein